MSITFTDDDLHAWEAYASGGDYGLSIHPRVIFNCVSDPTRRPRFIEVPGDEADAQGLVHDGAVDQLKDMLKRSVELD